MASSPSSSIPGRRSKPGCMGSIAHLFDFNQALAGRKLLTDKNYGAGLSPLRNGSSNFAEPLKSKSTSKAETQRGKTAVIARKSSEVPINALIAEDISEVLSKDSEQKSHAPSVVARLMGLDDLPHDSQSRFESYVEKVPSNRLQHGRGCAESTPSASVKLGRLPVCSVSDLSISKRSIQEEPMSSFGDFTVQSGSQESCSNVGDGSWKSWKSKDQSHMQALDDLDSQLATKKMLIQKKLSEAKLRLLSTHSCPKEKLYESKEFMDAINFLQANKNFFVRFLEEPDSLFARHLRNSEESRPSIEHARGHAHGGRPQSWTKESPDLMIKQPRSLGTELLADSSVSLVAQQKLVKGMKYNVSKSGEHHQAPTRIVVLKPGPSKSRKLMSLLQSSPSSPREFFDAMEFIKDSSMDVLKELRGKLQQEDGKGNMRHTWLPVHGPAKASKDPREIAREIARQVRRNVTRDLRASAKSTMLPPHGSPANRGRDEKGAESTGTLITIIASTKGSYEGSGADYIDRSSSNLSSQLLDRKASYGVKDEPRRSLDQPSIIAAHVDGYGGSSEYYPLETDTSEERGDCAMCEKLPRSRSIPTSSSSVHASQKEVLKENRRVPVCDIFVADGTGPRRSSNGILVQNDPLRYSIFRRRGSGSRGSLSKGKKQIKEVDAFPPFSSHEMSLGKTTQDTDIGSEKVQHQIDDSGPIPDSDSSVSSIDNLHALEAPTIAAQNVDPVTPGVQLSEDSEIFVHSPLVSPSKVTSLENDGTMSITSEVCEGSFEQPSPVSVLDAPFHEEPESPMDFSDISSGLQELRMRLQLLKFGDQVEKVPNQEGSQAGAPFTDDNPCAINVDVSDMATEDTEFYCQCMKNLSSLVDEIVCPQGKESELKYVSSLLVASGFMGDRDTILTHWHAPNQPLAPSLLKKLEEEEVGGLSSPTRHLLFDNVNEVLLNILGPLANCRISWKMLYGLTAACVIPSGKDLMQQVWAGVCRFSQEEDQDTLGNLVAKDLLRKGRWCDLGTEVEAVVLEVERAIYGVLIEEMLTM